jgi:RNA polymerase sigma-54 factor
MQLMRNIAQRKSTILRTCEVIVRRQQDFLDQGVEALRPMMIKEVAEEIGVHPSTVSRAVANKYAHTPQGVIELRFFFSEGSNGPEGADTPLLVLKRKVRKLIEEEDARHPLTDDQLAAMLQSQGIQLDAPHRGQVSRRHEHSVDASAASVVPTQIIPSG